MMLDKTQQGPVTHECIIGERLGESVSSDVCRGNVNERDGLLMNALPNVVEPRVNVFCSSASDGVISEVNRPFVIPIDGDGLVKREGDFAEERVIPSCLSCCLGEGNVFSFCG